MKNSYKIILMAVTLILSVTAVNAQSFPVTFGVKGGLNISNLDLSDDDAYYKDDDPRIGYNVGITVDFALPANLYILSGLELTSKGTDYDRHGNEFKPNLTYLQLPVNLGYKLNVTDELGFLFYAGFFGAYGVSGKTKIDGYKYDSFGGSGIFKRFDLGIVAGVSVQYGKFIGTISCDYGFIDINNNLVNNYSSRSIDVYTQNASIGVGYKF